MTNEERAQVIAYSMHELLTTQQADWLKDKLVGALAAAEARGLERGLDWAARTMELCNDPEGAAAIRALKEET